jgi:hypothetical protein
MPMPICESLYGGLIAFGFCFFYKVRIHVFVFVGFSGYAVFQIFFGRMHIAGYLKMLQCVNGFRIGRSTEQFGRIGLAVFLRFFRVGGVLSVCLGFTGKGRHQVFHGFVFAHFVILL